MTKKLGALIDYLKHSNRYELLAMAIMVGVLLTIVFVRPSQSQLPTALRVLALLTALAAKFFSNSNLAANPGTPAQQKESKVTALALDLLAAFLTIVSFCV